MKRTLNSSVQSSAVPSGINLFRLGDLGGAIQRRLSPIRYEALDRHLIFLVVGDGALVGLDDRR